MGAPPQNRAKIEYLVQTLRNEENLSFTETSTRLGYMAVGCLP